MPNANEDPRAVRRRPGPIATLLFAVLALILAVPPLEAGCKSECDATYASDCDECQLLHTGSDQADELQTCLDDAKSERDRCVDECNS